MKKKLIISLIFLISGIVVGNNLYNKVDLELIRTFQEENKYYCLQQGIYTSKESMQKEPVIERDEEVEEESQNEV